MADETVSVPTKVCTRCGEEKPATREFFPPHKHGKYGVHSLCRLCKKIDDASRRARPDQQVRQQAWRDANKDLVKLNNAAYRQAGYSSTAAVAAWRIKNLEHARKLAREGARRRRAEDVAFRLKARISARLYTMIKEKNGRATEELLGFTRAALKSHIERQFTKGMSWDALMRGEIEIDHIIPVSAFKITTTEDPNFKVCWALANLRPMWSRANRSKGAKRLTLL
jgi:hypothetical protein